MKNNKGFFDYLPGDKLPKERLEEILRVNHAGEFGAARIYEGQLSVLKKHKKISHMYEQEQEHLKYFEKKLLEERMRPSVLSPIWSVGGYLLGKLTAKLGEEASMAATEAVESVIQEHYQKQMDELGDDVPELKAKIRQFREEELEHHDEAIASGSRNAPCYKIMTSMIKWTSRIAIKLAEKL